MSPLNIGGISSGMDTDGMIKSLMALERRPVTVLEKRRDKLTQEGNAWRDMNNRLKNLEARLRDIATLPPASWDARKATVTDTSVLTAATDPAAQPGSYTVDVVSLATTTTLKSGVATANASLALGFVGTITVAGGPGNTKTFGVVATDSLNDIAATINKNSSTLGFTAAVIAVAPGDNRLVLSGTTTGAANDFALTGAVADSLGLTTVSGATKPNSAADAKLKINGIDIISPDNTVTSALQGVALTLLKAGGKTTVTVSKDTATVVNSIKNFVDQYNSVIELISQQTRYDKEKKKPGVLAGDGMVADIRSGLGRLLTEVVPGVPEPYNSLSMVGITTAAFTSGDAAPGKLSLDTKKLQDALEKDPSAVRTLFTRDVTGGEGVVTRARSWVQRITESGGMVPKQTDLADKAVKDLKDRITYFDEKILPMREKRLRTQFSNMERVMGAMMNQGNWLSNQLKHL